jgi:trypsin
MMTRSFLCMLLLLCIACVRATNDVRIVGGVEIDIDEAPYQVALLSRSHSLGQFCGGTVVSPNWILSAAHCLESIDTTDVLVGFGDSNLAHMRENFDAHAIGVRGWNFHPQWQGDVDDSLESVDAVLLRIDGFVVAANSSSDAAAVVQLARDPVDVGQQLFVSGFGAHDEDGDDHDDLLRAVFVPARNPNECQLGGASARYFCAGSLGPPTLDSCVGDSGGPAVLITGDGDDDKHIALVGIVSFAFTADGEPVCAGRGGYTRVDQLIGWIEATIAADQPQFYNEPSAASALLSSATFSFAIIILALVLL